MIKQNKISLARIIIAIWMLSMGSLFAFEDITKENFTQKTGNKNAIVKFHASWCTNCKTVQKNLEQLDLKELGVEVFKVNIEDQMELAQRYKVRAIPTLIYLKNGKLISTQVGVKTANEIKNNIQQKYN